MIIDTLSKYEVMAQLRKEFDEEILPYYYRKIRPRIENIIRPQSQREKKTITLGWETVESKGKNLFKILLRGNSTDDLPLFVAEFRWQNKLCFGNFFLEENVVVYQSHSLTRYAQRVLKNESDISKVFYNYILKRQAEAFHIVLPTRTHKYSIYFGIAKALFLGDFDEKHPKTAYMWLNTCISYDEAKYSQYRIMQSLHDLQKYIESNRCNFSDPKNKEQLQEYIKKYATDENRIKNLRRFLSQYYLLLQLHLNFKFSFTDIFRDEIDLRLDYLKEALNLLGISTNSLSPYSKTHGIAWKGEIDYIE